MRTGRIANQADTLRIDIEFAGLGAHELDGGLGIVNGGGVNTLFGQPVFDREKRVAIASEKRAPVIVKVAAADLPPATVYRDQDRRFAAALGQIEVADELDAIVLAKQKARAVYDLVFRRRRSKRGVHCHILCDKFPMRPHKR